MDQEIHVVAFITAVPEAEEHVKQTLKIAEQAVQTEPGCLRYELTQDPQQSRVFVMLEHWRTMADLKAHERAEPFQSLVKAIAGKAELKVFVTQPVP